MAITIIPTNCTNIRCVRRLAIGAVSTFAAAGIVMAFSTPALAMKWIPFQVAFCRAIGNRPKRFSSFSPSLDIS